MPFPDEVVIACNAACRWFEGMAETISSYAVRSLPTTTGEGAGLLEAGEGTSAVGPGQ